MGIKNILGRFRRAGQRPQDPKPETSGASSEPVRNSERSVGNLEQRIIECERRVIASVALIEGYGEGHDIEFSAENTYEKFEKKTYQRHEKVRAVLLEKKDAAGIQLLAKLIDTGLAYFGAIMVAHNATRSPDPRRAMQADVLRSSAHDNFIGSLIDLEKHLRGKHPGSESDDGIYSLDKSHLNRPYDRDQRSYIRTFGYALLAGIRGHVS